MNVLALFGIILLLAFAVESLTEYLFGKLCDNVASLLRFKWLIAYIAMLFGVVAAFVYQLDLVSMAGEWFGYPIPVHPFGLVLTGLSIGRGANFIHQIASTYFPAKK